MAKLWGIHMPESVGYDTVEQGYVAIGWPEMGDISKISADREAFKVSLTKTYPNMKQGGIPVEAGILFRFTHEVEIGDYVVYPSKHNRMVNIGRFTGQQSYVPKLNGKINEFPNRRNVEWLGHFTRSEFSQSALYEIGSFTTLFRIKKHAAIFLAKVDPTIEVPDEDTGEEIPDDNRVAENVSKQAEETTQDYVIRKSTRN